MAEEDLIFGKNRHFFGGIEPSNMLAFTAHGGMPQGQYRVFITATLPNDTVVNLRLRVACAGPFLLSENRSN